MKGDKRFTKRERILKPGEFRELYEEGTRCSVGEFLLFVRPANEGPLRAGFAVSSKLGSATTRNRIKRYLREIVRTHKGDLKRGLRVVIVARPGANQLTFAQCREKILELFRKGNVIGG